MKKTIVFGCFGQDSYFLIKLLEARGDHIIGVHRRGSQHDFTDFKNINNLTFEMCDLTDASGVSDLINRHKPDEVYNLAAQSFVGISFQNPTHTLYNNIIGQTNLLESIRRISPTTKLYYAGSSEEFGNQFDVDAEGTRYQDDNTKLWPVSPYGVSKVACRHLNDIYRKAYGMFVCTAQNHNHSSFRRPETFVFGKITAYAGRLKRWLDEHAILQIEENVIKGKSIKGIHNFPKLELGNIASVRDESHSTDMMRAAILMMSQDVADDYVVCSGTGISVEEVLRKSFEYIGIHKYDNFWTVNPKFFRELELDFLKGDCSKIRSLGWKPEISLDHLIKESIEYHYERANKT